MYSAWGGVEVTKSFLHSSTFGAPRWSAFCFWLLEAANLVRSRWYRISRLSNEFQISGYPSSASETVRKGSGDERLSHLQRRPWHVLASVNRWPHNSCSFEREMILNTRICFLRLGKCKDTCFPEIFNCCGGIARKSWDPCKKNRGHQGQNIPAVPP